MPLRTPWDPSYDTGDAAVDAAHQALLGHCEALAELCAGGAVADVDGDASLSHRFDEALARLVAQVREHFEAEAAWIARGGEDAVEDHHAEREAFDDLLADVATTEHFDRLELQRFVALWCVGHVTASASMRRAAPQDGPG